MKREEEEEALLSSFFLLFLVLKLFKTFQKIKYIYSYKNVQLTVTSFELDMFKLLSLSYNVYM